MSILTRYLIKEILGPFFFGIFAFTSMISGVALINLLRETEQANISIFTNLKLLMLTVPQNVMWGAIISVLLATLLGLGKLTSHSETIAMRAGGLSYVKIAVPVVFIGLIISVFGILLNEYVIPASLRYKEKIRQEIANQGINVKIYNFSQSFYENGFLNKMVSAQTYDSKLQQLQKVVIVELNQGKISRTIEASVMNWTGANWVFEQGRIYHYNSESLYPMTMERAKVRYGLNLTPKEIEQRDLPPEQKSISELNTYINKFVNSGQEKKRLLVDLHSKFSLPFASLVFAVLGIPMALKPQRRSTASGFGLCLIFILVWWALFAYGQYLGRNGTISPFLGAWLANFVLIGFGGYVYSKAKS